MEKTKQVKRTGKRVQFLLLELSQKKTDRAFREKGFQEKIVKNKTVNSSVKRRHSDDNGHKTDGATKETVDDIKDGANQSKQDSNVDQKKEKEHVKKKSDAEPAFSSSSFIHNIATKVVGIHQSHAVKTVGDPTDTKEPFHRNCSAETTCYTKGHDEQAMETSEIVIPSNSSFDGDMPMKKDTTNSPRNCRQQAEERQIASNVIDIRDISNNEAEWGDGI